MIKTIDDFLPAHLWYWITASRDEYTYRLVDTEGDASKHEANLSPSVNQLIREVYESKVGSIEHNFYCTIVKAEPGYWYPDHADHPSKIVSSVLYLWPDEGDGTQFRNEQDVAWQTNRLVTWHNQGQVHRYGNTTTQARYTLNLYQLDGEHQLGVSNT